MKEVGCCLCGSDAKSVLFAQEGFDPYLKTISEDLEKIPRFWCVCDNCGFVYRSPTLEDHELARLYEHYEEEIFKSTTPDAYFDKIVGIPDAESENVQKINWLKETLGEQGPGKPAAEMSVLDVGCGGGTLLYAIFEKLGCTDLCGVEMNKAYAGLAARRLDADIRNQSYSSGMFERTFDLVVNTKVLEHVPKPGAFIRELASDLSPEGILFLEVPDIMDVYMLPPRHDRFYIPHIFYFSANTLREFLAGAGLSIITHRSVTTHRGRSYLQILAARSREAARSDAPYDDPEALKQKVLERSGK